MVNDLDTAAAATNMLAFETVSLAPTDSYGFKAMNAGAVLNSRSKTHPYCDTDQDVASNSPEKNLMPLWDNRLFAVELESLTLWM